MVRCCFLLLLLLSLACAAPVVGFFGNSTNGLAPVVYDVDIFDVAYHRSQC